VIDAGIDPEQVHAALAALANASDAAGAAIAEALTSALAAPGAHVDPTALLATSRLPLCQGAGRLLIHQIGAHLAASSDLAIPAASAAPPGDP